ncbi:TetR/AcrR family transcriptional regulator [Dictyobacter formicarum]|uniref:HTH-type transcriptional regulator YfiR n=1 Tax=Dictyobacter formicarum TaxID=2778368 RepID=A0ABQ3VIE5_9CHLR|nr:TetR/AcrR family transcriptional regulator [Dictyobacter formicarum]GHO85825.1 putative HTH-type transcriptional regulator YfiR [Dictyobacter formicarum]
MSPRPDVSEERKQQILEAAIAVFARLGFHASRMDDIATQAGLSKGALYLYYKNKDALIVALLKYFFTQEMKHLRAFVEANRDEAVAEQLLLLTRQFSATMQSMIDLMPISFEFYALAGRDGEIRQFLQEYFQEYRRDLARLIERGIERGEFQPVDAQATAVTIAALYEGLALLHFVDMQAFQWAAQAETSIQLLLAGLRPIPLHK